jgi:hypothetical protein
MWLQNVDARGEHGHDDLHGVTHRRTTANRVVV